MSDLVRVGCIGTGGMAQAHLNDLAKLEDVKIVALCDVVEERANAAAERYGGKAYTDYRRLLDEAELDALYICLPPFAHSDVGVRAARRGLHLFVEKPVALDLETGIRTAEAIKEAGVISCVGYQVRYWPVVQATRSFLEGKTIGMVACYRWNGVPGGPDHWWRVMAKSGGMLHEQATHQVDLMRYCAGEVAEVYKLEALRINLDQENHTIPDCEVATLQFASGAVGYISTTCALTAGGGGAAIDFFTEGHLRVTMGWTDVRIEPEGTATVEVPDTPAPSIDAAFIDAIRSGDQSRVLSSYSDGLKSAAVSLAANQSAREHRPVRVPETP